MSLNIKNINSITQWKKWFSQCDDHTRDHAHATKATRAIWVQYVECIVHLQYTIAYKEPIRKREIKLECMNRAQNDANF